MTGPLLSALLHSDKLSTWRKSMSMSLLMWILMLFCLQKGWVDSHSPEQNNTNLFYFLSCLVASHILLTLCSVGLSLYLQSRFLYTFDNQIIYVKKRQKYIYIYLPVMLSVSELVCQWSSCEFLHVKILVCFLDECILLALLNCFGKLVYLYILSQRYFKMFLNINTENI